MARLGLPTVEIIFKELGTSAIMRGESGVVALILKKEGGYRVSKNASKTYCSY